MSRWWWVLFIVLATGCFVPAKAFNESDSYWGMASGQCARALELAPDTTARLIQPVITVDSVRYVDRLGVNGVRRSQVNCFLMWQEMLTDQAIPAEADVK